MIRLALALLIGGLSPVMAQIALTPQYDTRRLACSPADCAAIKRSQDAPWVDRAVDFNGIGTAAAKAMAKCVRPEDCQGWVCGSYGCVKPGR